jgi:hypothetical protein
VFRLGSFGGVREGLLKSAFDNSMERSDSDAHPRYRAAGGAALDRLDNSIAHAKFMHRSSVPRRRGIAP